MADATPRELAQKFGYSTYLVERYVELFGLDNTLRLLEANEMGLKRCIRINTLRVQTDNLLQRLERKGFKLGRIGWVPYGFRVLEERFPLGSTPEFMMGYYYVQDAASMLPAYVLAPGPNDCVVDLGAAPGGKTTQLAQIMGNRGVIVAVDLSRERMKSLRSNLSRCGVANVIAYRMDGKDLPSLDLTINKILLDAPCSCDGVIPVDPSRKKSRTIEDIKFCSMIQRKLVVSAIRSLQPKGEMVYSTCSTAPEENEFIIADAIREFDVEVMDTGLDFGDEGLREAFGVKLPDELRLARRFYPHKHGVEGFFLCKLRKR
ncbi:MAG: RsmB/NOP family class I SAM-dependent RNA methyltransferase [Promethearchaeati archaeon SRVP18_Atabeyarchaeia-1]